MSSDAARLEALGEPHVRFRWRNHDLTIPRALEDWPLDLIRNGQYVDAVLALLDGQTAPIPLYGDVVSLSDAMAAAVGVERLPESKPRDRIEWPDNIDGDEIPPRTKFLAVFAADLFGAVPILLALLDMHEDDIAADLKTFRNVDYLDRWRGGLTLRQIWIYIRRIPPDSALAVARNGGHELWTKQTVVLAQLWELLARQPYFGRPAAREELEAVAAKRAEQQQQMDKLAGKEDYWSPEASQARAQEKARKAAHAAATAAAAGAPQTEPPPTALSALDKAMAARRREINNTPRKAG